MTAINILFIFRFTFGSLKSTKIDCMPDTKIKIAIADALWIVRNGIVTLLREYKNCNVILQAEDGKELIDKLSLLEELPDVCIIETNNEILNGYKTLIDLQKLFPTIKILAVSSYELEYTIIKMIQHGIKGYVTKQCKIYQLYAAIEHLYTNDYYYSEIAPETLFEKARREPLPELTKEESQLLSLAANKFKKKKIPDEMFIQECISNDSFVPIIKKLNLHDHIGLAIYMMQIGLVPPSHFI